MVTVTPVFVRKGKLFVVTDLPTVFLTNNFLDSLERIARKTLPIAKTIHVLQVQRALIWLPVSIANVHLT